MLDLYTKKKSKICKICYISYIYVTIVIWKAIIRVGIPTNETADAVFSLATESLHVILQGYSSLSYICYTFFDEFGWCFFQELTGYFYMTHNIGQKVNGDGRFKLY